MKQKQKRKPPHMKEPQSRPRTIVSNEVSDATRFFRVVSIAFFWFSCEKNVDIAIQTQIKQNVFVLKLNNNKDSLN